jgi:Mg-chelatase subunit ChlD
MTLVAPWALAALAALPLLVWLHRRARPRGDRPFSAFYLLPASAGALHLGGRLRAPLLMAVRLAAAGALVLAAAGPATPDAPGTLVLAAGPLPPDVRYAAPVVVVRAGRPPTFADGEVAPVAGPPDWGAALALGRERAPDAPVVRVPAPPPSRPRVLSAGAALSGDHVVVDAVIAGAGAPSIEGHALRPLGQGAWRFEGVLSPGPALVRVGDDAWPVCVPDASPLPVADAGWPPAVAAVLDVLPNARKAPADRAVWRPGPAPAAAPGWAPFAPAAIAFEFAAGPANRGTAPLWAEASLPPPGAVVRRWRPLAPAGDPVLRAGDEVVADRTDGPAGAARRFGFDPADSDLPDTAAWPVLFAQALDEDRAARARCVPHEAGTPLRLAVDGPLRVTPPAGPARTLAPQGGAVLLDGLDQVGVYRLESGGREASVAVVPPTAASSPDEPDVVATAHAATVRRTPVLATALALLAAALVLGRRHRSPRAWAALGAAAVALAPWRVGGGDPPPVVVAVDVSGSMPRAETAAATARLEAALGGVPLRRVVGDDRVRSAGPPGGEPAFTGGATRHGPLLEAASALAGEGGAIVLVTDGRAPDGPAPASRPVFVLPVSRPGIDAGIVDGKAVRLGDEVRVRVTVTADADIEAVAHLGPATTRVRLARGVPRTVAAVVPAADTVDVALEAPDDLNPANDRLSLPVEGGAPGHARVIGDGALPWARAAGLDARPLLPSALAETPLDEERAILVHDPGALDDAAVARLQRWTAAGGVLLLAGRAHAFGPGGWAGTALDALSPLAADPRPPTGARIAAVLLLDRSGSMDREAGGIGADGVARLAAGLAGALDGEGDQLGVVAFGADAEVLLPPTPAAEVRKGALPVPAIVQGGTMIRPGMERALDLLERADVDARVLIVVSDGHFVDGEEARKPLADRLRKVGARVVGVLVGDSATHVPIEEMANETGGVVIDALPDQAPHLTRAGVLAAATGDLLAAGGPVAPGPAWEARVGGEAPPVPDRVRVRARSTARVLARAGGEPILAEQAYGAGRVIALATDRWDLPASGWRALLSPALADAPGNAQLYVADGRLHLVGAPDDPPPRGPARLTGRDGTVEAPWRVEAPGHAVAALPPGPVEILRVEADTAAGPVLGRVARPPSPEVAAVGVDAAAVAAQAALTGGAVLRAPEDVSAVLAARRRTGGWPTAPVLALLALALAVADAAAWAGVRIRRSTQVRAVPTPTT